jgi:hypothetical protein
MSGPAVPPSYGAREAQPIDQLMDQFGAPGWGFFDEILKRSQDAREGPKIEPEAVEAARAAARLFDSDDGRRVLEFLADHSVRRPVFSYGMPDPALYAALREGQNGLFFTLLKLIAVGRGENPPVREGA